MTYNVFGGTLSLAHSLTPECCREFYDTVLLHWYSQHRVCFTVNKCYTRCQTVIVISIKTFSFPAGLITRTLGPSNDFTLLNSWICLHGMLD